MQRMKSVDVADLTRVLMPTQRFEPTTGTEPAPGLGVANTISMKHLWEILRRRVGWLVLAMLLGLVTPSAGSIRVLGHDLLRDRF